MEDIFFNHVLPYINPIIIHNNNLSLLCKDKRLCNIQKKINRHHSAKMLCNRFWTNQMQQMIHVFLDEYSMFLKYIIEILLKERDIDIISESQRYEKHKLLVPKYVLSNTIIEYNDNNKIINIDFKSGQQIIEDVKVCSVYRMGTVQKSILVDNYPLAKALIY